MKLIYYRHDVPNFGDDLNTDLWPQFAPSLFENEADGRGFVGIGTIIGMDTGDVSRLEIFSTGAGYSHVERWAQKQMNVHCVRGPLTAKLLGVVPEKAICDGAVTTPLSRSFPDRKIGGGGTVVIPHFETLAYPGWQEACAQAGFALIDPRGTPAEVIHAIAGADLVLTESLHGAIIADVYGIPWTAFCTSRNISTSKWVDWLATVSLDFHVTIVPPPNAAQLLKFGRRPEAFGTTLTFTLEQAFVEYASRMKHIEVHGYGPPTGIRGALKRTLAMVPALQRVLGFSPSRTAEALTALSRKPTFVSDEGRRESLRSQMMDTLRTLERTSAGG